MERAQYQMTILLLLLLLSVGHVYKEGLSQQGVWVTFENNIFSMQHLTKFVQLQIQRVQWYWWTPFANENVDFFAKNCYFSLFFSKLMRTRSTSLLN